MKLLIFLHLPKDRIWLLVFNPLFLIESVQNAHFEGVTLTFLVLSLYYLALHKIKIAAVLLTVSIHVKLIPILVLPFFIKRIGLRNTFYFGFWTLLLSAMLFLIFIDAQNVSHFLQSIQLYYKKFEFNSSLYAFLQSVLPQRYYYFSRLGPLLAKIAFLLIIVISLYGSKFTWQKILERLTIAFFIYYLFASTVHPWYVLVPLTLSTFTSYRFAIVWSLLVILSYARYSNLPEFAVHLLIFLEYSIVLFYFASDLWPTKKK
jgi:alpha-1,6-mannosyltransferase